MRVCPFKIKKTQAERLDYLMNKYLKERVIEPAPKRERGRPKRRGD